MSSGRWKWLLPEDTTPGMRETAVWTPAQLEPPDENDRINTSCSYGFAFDICAVEIDRNTGKVRIDRYVTAHDAGTLLNPALADGQIRGGFAQAVGAASSTTSIKLATPANQRSHVEPFAQLDWPRAMATPCR